MEGSPLSTFGPAFAQEDQHAAQSCEVGGSRRSRPVRAMLLPGLPGSRAFQRLPLLATDFLLRAPRSGWLQQPQGCCWDDWFPWGRAEMCPNTSACCAGLDPLDPGGSVGGSWTQHDLQCVARLGPFPSGMACGVPGSGIAASRGLRVAFLLEVGCGC